MRLRTVNNILLGLIILINLYVVSAPLLPSLFFSLHNTAQAREHLQASVHKPPSAGSSSPPSNRIIIPSMLLDQPILEGSTRQGYKVLNSGIWRWPSGSAPDHGSNTVLIGHRFTYTNPRGVFYYLNKVRIGDEIGVWWNRKNYVYRVRAVQVMPPTATYIEDASSEPQLTLFTCTPLWLPKDRLVVTASLEAGT